MPDQKTLNYILLAVVVGGLMIVRMRRMSRTQPLKLERLWILPAVLLVGAVAALIQLPPHPQDWPWLVAALAVGAGLGWIRGSMMAITIEADTHALNTRASPAAIVLLLAVFALRFGLRAALARNAGAWHIGAALITDAFILFAVGLLCVQRVEMAIRAMRLLGATREAKGSTPSSS
jgi:hypothetical protein